MNNENRFDLKVYSLEVIVQDLGVFNIKKWKKFEEVY